MQHHALRVSRPYIAHRLLMIQAAHSAPCRHAVAHVASLISSHTWHAHGNEERIHRSSILYALPVADVCILSSAGECASPAFSSATLVSPRRASMLGKAAAIAAAASLSTVPSAAEASAGPMDSPARAESAADPSQTAALWQAAARTSAAAAPAAGSLSSAALEPVESLEPQQLRRDGAGIRPDMAPAAAVWGGHVAPVPADLAVIRRHPDAASGCGQPASIVPRGVSEPTTPGRDSGEARSPLRGGCQTPDQQRLSPGGSRGFTAAELRAYEATNQLLRELHFERLGRLSIRDDDEGSLAHEPEQQPHHQSHRKRR